MAGTAGIGESVRVNIGFSVTLGDDSGFTDLDESEVSMSLAGFRRRMPECLS